MFIDFYLSFTIPFSLRLSLTFRFFVWFYPFHFITRALERQVDQFAYYKVVSEAAETTSKGCMNAVRNMLNKALVGVAKADIITNLNLCTPLPDYINVSIHTQEK
jgi:hypothetical protein